VTSRVAQGVGTVLVAPAALSLITTGFAEGPARTRALGMYGATASVGFAAGAFGARLASLIGMRRLLVLASGAATVGFLVLMRLPASGSYSPVLAAVMLVGFGTAGVAFGAMVTASGGVPNDDQGLVGGVINTSRQIGAAIGAALLPTVAEVANGGEVAGAVGDRTAMLTGGLAAAVATGVAWRASARPRLRQT
jgi:MFS family permease